MCGICGILGPGATRERLDAMRAQMAHRGPDGEGVYLAPDGMIGLGHQRLSIVDLEGGAQPMASADGGLVVVYNGEIYNFMDLRRELESRGRVFRTRCDTETLLHAYAEWGEEMVRRLNGIFAFGLWDAPRRRLVLARDPMGVKPLFYAETPESFVFASEVKSLLTLPWVRRDVDPAALRLYLRLRYVPGPHTMWRSIRRFPPGHRMTIENGAVCTKPYWQTRFRGEERWKREEDAIDEFASLAEDAVRMQMMADVPVGAFLSGGVDSGSIVSLMARHTDEPVRTFSMGFGTARDETAAAESLARRIGARHTSIRMRPDDMRLLPDAVRLMDEPLGDAIILPLYLLSRAAAREVKVVLTGEGADELLGGYLHQKNLLRLFGASRRLGPLARAVGRAAGWAVSRTPVAWLDRFFDYPSSLGVSGRERLAAMLAAMGHPEAMYMAHVSLFDDAALDGLLRPEWRDGHDDVRDVTGDLAADLARSRERGAQGLFDALLEQECRFWLPDNILLKMDKMTMGASLEGRVPFLDPRLVELATALPIGWKIRRGTNKRILRTCAERWIPGYAGGGRKQAFHVPLEEAYGEALARLEEEWLGDERLRGQEWLDPDAVRRLRDGTGRLDLLHGKQRMSLVILMMWREAMRAVPVAA
ncbi:asparagine synthase (glutamine-hydrolyzing) [Candidatus Sumerlaeota bacterium]|nr:asparagine synthase (glutamine-hydrolyzing) [Candidatus Sumerlaeota bacterium]